MVGAVSSAAPAAPLRADAGRAPAEDPHQGHAHEQAAKEATGLGGLTAEEQAVVAELQRTDREVRAHEQAHLAAAGGLAGGVSFTYTTGPDGRQYAVGGEVSIDTSPVDGDPQATIQKAQQIRAAANAPANPSGQDRQVAAAAAAMEAAARVELAREQREDQARQFQQAGGDESETERLLSVLI